MFKIAFISVALIVLSFVSGTAYAINIDSVRVLNVMNNDTVFSQAANKTKDIAKNTAVQSKSQFADKSESAFSADWLFVAALFWFVIMSNRRGV